MSDEQAHGHWDKDQQRYEDGEKSHPCVHAPVGPDWAGLRELPTPKPNYAALVEEARRRVNDAVPAWGWCMYPTLSRGYLDTPFAEETSWTISEPYCGPGVWCGDGECAGTCGAEVIRTGSEGCEEDWMSAPVAVFVSTAPDDVRALADAVEALVAENEKLREEANPWETFAASDGVTSIRRKSDPERERLAAMFTAEQVKSNEYRREYMKAKRERDALRTENEKLRAHIDAPWTGDDQ